LRVAYLLLLCAAMLGAQDHKWLERVSGDVRAKKNPLTHDKDSTKAGEKVYRKECAQCHGEHAEGKTGKKVRPPLKSDVVKHASDGELFWLLANGSVRNGMPSWSELPEGVRWQVVSFLRKLNK
jgi:thiosulfate dehydrogenase